MVQEDAAADDDGHDDGEDDGNGDDDNEDDCRAGQCWQRRRRGSPDYREALRLGLRSTCPCTRPCKALHTTAHMHSTA